MYLVLRPPWGGHAGAVPSDASPPIAVVTRDAGVMKKKKPRHHPPVQGQPTQPTDTPGDQLGAGDDEPDSTPPPPQLVKLTGADRGSEWRGDAVALPPNKINMSGGAEARPLDDGEIHAGIASGAGAVQQCVVVGATNTDLKATITLEMLVDGTGRVTKSRVNAPHYLHEHGLLECARRAIGKMHFAATGGATLVTLPVTLS